MKKAYKLKDKQALIDEHWNLAMDIALYSVRIVAMQRTLESQSDKLLALEGEIEKLEAIENGRGLN